MTKRVLAIDLGASTGRGLIAELDGGKISLEEIERFNNTPVSLMGTTYWDVLRLFHHIKNCLLKAKPYDIQSLSIDTWGVDFALLDRDGVLQGNPVHFRDKRTTGMVDYAIRTEIARERLYEITGIEIMEKNTLFQLEALQLNHDSHVEAAKELLFMPDLFNYFLSGEDRTEPSIASTSQMLDARTKQWSWEIIEDIQLDSPALPGIVPSGTVIGKLLPDIAHELGVERTDIIAGCGHDTQCAVAAVPAEEKDFLFLDCGTWCLLGTELDGPLINEKTLELNLSNETGFEGRTTLLKNIVGLWLIQESRRQWIREGQEYSFAELEELAKDAEPFRSFVDPSAPEFSAAGNIPEHIREFCEFTGQPLPESIGEVVRCIYESLAFKYREVIEEIQDVTGKKFKNLYMVGGGAKDETLAQAAADACGIRVVVGPVEATAYGNAAIQFIAKRDITDLDEARQIIRDSIEPKVFEPKNADAWNEAYKRFRKFTAET
ncbi:rhamnulokinase [Ruminococcus sp. YE71]|uniref:rhamnulokinase n=1 Tax=unclassified Ruminococcus TaxID=2608920 RepID=UPI000888246A|nr:MULTISPECIES: rhamnulokinase family protein [unclassified Ruminococcus]SDA10384.1 rhamnulokinase [Ruminococcus sp. YE78]SFW10757.1 rhamnulokinase [Ruminococcus sp. YE71]